jgi:hypothetical protein
MLRKAILAYGVFAIALGIVLALIGAGATIIIYVVVQGIVVIAALLFERGRYRPIGTESGPWQDTDERFVDPTTGTLMKVRYNPRTGARDYVPLKPPP